MALELDAGSIVGFETKFTGDDKAGTFEGYGAVFNNVDQGFDVVAPGAFSESIAKRTAKGIKLLWQHNPDEPIGMFDELAEDSKGLKVKGRLLLTVRRAAETYELMKEGIVDGLSIGFRTLKDEVDRQTGIRKILKADLREISIVLWPMNPKAKLAKVKNELVMPTRKEIETALREEAGLSHEASRKAAAVVKGLLRKGDDETAGGLRNEALAASLNGALDKCLRAIRNT